MLPGFGQLAPSMRGASRIEGANCPFAGQNRGSNRHLATSMREWAVTDVSNCPKLLTTHAETTTPLLG